MTLLSARKRMAVIHRVIVAVIGNMQTTDSVTGGFFCLHNSSNAHASPPTLFTVSTLDFVDDVERCYSRGIAWGAYGEIIGGHA